MTKLYWVTTALGVIAALIMAYAGIHPVYAIVFACVAVILAVDGMSVYYSIKDKSIDKLKIARFVLVGLCGLLVLLGVLMPTWSLVLTFYSLAIAAFVAAAIIYRFYETKTSADAEESAETEETTKTLMDCVRDMDPTVAKNVLYRELKYKITGDNLLGEIDYSRPLCTVSGEIMSAKDADDKGASEIAAAGYEYIDNLFANA